MSIDLVKKKKKTQNLLKKSQLLKWKQNKMRKLSIQPITFET